MNTIKNIHKLTGIVPAADIIKIDLGANLHLRHSNIGFKIISVNGQDIVIKTVQAKPFSDNIADKETLIKRTRELFGKFLPDNFTIKVQPVPYQETRVNIVNPDWINKQMLSNGIKLKDIVNDTGLNKTQLSAVIGGDKPLSQIMKALFFFYFAGK